MRLNVLQSWWPRSDEQVRNDGEPAQVCPPIVSPGKGTEPVRSPRPTPLALDPAQARDLSVCPAVPSSGKRKARPRRKQYKVAALRGRERSTPAQLQAAALLHQIADACPELIGSWVKKNELRNWYFELAALEGWEAQGWIRVAKALKEWTTSQRITRNGEKLTCYKVVAISMRLKRRAVQLSRQSNSSATTSDPAPGPPDPFVESRH